MRNLASLVESILLHSYTDLTTPVLNGHHCVICKLTPSAHYPRVTFNKRGLTASRVVWEFEIGALPDYLVVRHACDTKRCVEIMHLSSGTQKDNIADKMQRGRQARGSRNGASLLSESDVLEIIRDRRIAAIIADEYGVKPSTIAAIRAGKNWNYLTRIKDRRSEVSV